MAIVVWLFVPDHKSKISRSYSYTLFDSAFSIRTPFPLKDSSKTFVSTSIIEKYRSISYLNNNIEFDIEGYKYQFSCPG